jgi:hypothetical protein
MEALKMNAFVPILSLSPIPKIYIIIGVVLVTTVILVVYGWYCSNRVDETSRMLHELNKLNESYHFHMGIKKTERLTKPCNSKAQYDKIKLENFFKAVAEENIKCYDGLLTKIEANKMLYKEYSHEYDTIKSSADKSTIKGYVIPLFLYKMIESHIFRKNKVFPRMDTNFIIRATYVSPQGKNSYQKTYNYSLAEAKKVLDEVHLSIDRKKTKEFQRAIMSDAVRYEIMHRDGFKCQLCGRSAKDGAILHIDHIIPISKGGKTEKSNLRTLCDQCNLGKKDRID